MGASNAKASAIYEIVITDPFLNLKKNLSKQLPRKAEMKRMNAFRISEISNVAFNPPNLFKKLAIIN